MNIKRILLTGDDGYNSIGTRLLVYFLKDRYELAIAGTNKQQSGVGGHMSVARGGKWEEAMVEGIPAFWVDGYPADAIELAVGLLKKPFDLVISGINLGANIGGAIFSSGTYAAAHRAVSLGLAPYAIAMSWDAHNSLYFKDHNGAEDTAQYIDYPGAAAYDVLKLAFDHDFWGAKILNINLPAARSRTVHFTKPLPDLKEFYKYPLDIDYRHHKFSYPKDDIRKRPTHDKSLDAGAIMSGYISVSLYKTDLVEEDLYKNIKNKELTL